MKKTIKKIVAGLLMIPIIAASAVVFMPSEGFAALNCGDGSYSIENGSKCASNNNTTTLFGADGMFTKVINTVLFVLGAVSVVMMIYGGVRYTLSGGDSSSVTAAKNTILYAVIGLVVALLAFSISNFVISAIK